jgi:hypothetical protein
MPALMVSVAGRLPLLCRASLCVAGQGQTVWLRSTADKYEGEGDLSEDELGMQLRSCSTPLIHKGAVNYTFLPDNAPPPQPDFTLTVNPSSLGTLAIGSQGVAGISIGTMNGFTDTVNLSCSVQPASGSAPACSITPSALNIPLNGAGSATLAVNTTGLTAQETRHTSAVLALCIPFLGTLVGVRIKPQTSWRLRNWVRLLLLACLLSLMCFALACGSGGGGTTGGVAQPGNYTVVISGQGLTTLVTHSVQVTLTVQ